VPRLLDEFALNTAQFGGLYAVATLTSAASLPFFGRLIDRVTLRSFSLAVGWGLVAACFLMATAPGVPVLFLAILGLRLTGQGLLSLTASTTMARVFTEGRGKALSVSGLGYPLGEGLLPMAIVLLVHAAGWRLSWGMASSLSAPSKGPWPPSAFSPPRWVRYAHQITVALARGAAAFVEGPDHQALSPTAITRGEDSRHVGGVLFERRLHVRSRVAFDPELIEQGLFRPEKPIASNTSCAGTTFSVPATSSGNELALFRCEPTRSGRSRLFDVTTGIAIELLHRGEINPRITAELGGGFLLTVIQP
jgi:MFS family permease